MHQLMNIDAVVRLIRSGRPLAVTGVEAALDQLPIGPWIGATMPYLKQVQGGVRTDRQVFVTELPAQGATQLRLLPTDALGEVVSHGPAAGYSLAMVPEGSDAHQRCGAAWGAGAPVVSWLARAEANRPGQAPLVYFGKTGQKLAEGAVVAHVRLAPGQQPGDELATLMAPVGVEVLGLAPGAAPARERADEALMPV